MRASVPGGFVTERIMYWRAFVCAHLSEGFSVCAHNIIWLRVAVDDSDIHRSFRFLIRFSFVNFHLFATVCLLLYRINAFGICPFTIINV